MEAIISTQIPEFKVQAFQKGGFKTVPNEGVKSKWAIFFFYPADFTFVCPTELIDLAGGYEELEKAGVEAFSVGCDTRFVHKTWYNTFDSVKKINYTMPADSLAVLAKGFGMYKGDEGVAYRGAFLVDPGGKIKVAEIQNNSIGRSAGELARRVSATQFIESHPGEVCPAKWKQGKETLKPSIDLVGKL